MDAKTLERQALKDKLAGASLAANLLRTLQRDRDTWAAASATIELLQSAGQTLSETQAAIAAERAKVEELKATTTAQFVEPAKAEAAKIVADGRAEIEAAKLAARGELDALEHAIGAKRAELAKLEDRIADVKQRAAAMAGG